MSKVYIVVVEVPGQKTNIVSSMFKTKQAAEDYAKCVKGAKKEVIEFKSP